MPHPVYKEILDSLLTANYEEGDGLEAPMELLTQNNLLRNVRPFTSLPMFRRNVMPFPSWFKSKPSFQSEISKQNHFLSLNVSSYM
jgi:hypothetical protein